MGTFAALALVIHICVVKSKKLDKNSKEEDHLSTFAGVTPYSSGAVTKFSINQLKVMSHNFCVTAHDCVQCLIMAKFFFCFVFLILKFRRYYGDGKTRLGMTPSSSPFTDVLALYSKPVIA